MFNNKRLEKIEEGLTFRKEGYFTYEDIPLKDQVQVLTDRLEKLEEFLKVEYVEETSEFKGYKKIKKEDTNQDTWEETMRNYQFPKIRLTKTKRNN